MENSAFFKNPLAHAIEKQESKNRAHTWNTVKAREKQPYVNCK